MTMAEYKAYDEKSLHALAPVIKKIRDVFGAPSISCGVLSNGHYHFYADGLADAANGLQANEETVYCVASCSKAFTTATCGILVSEGLLSWTDPVERYIPDFRSTSDIEISKRATLLDMCSHGTGLAPLDHAVAGFYDEMVNDGDAQISIASNLPVCYDFRSRFLYNNTILGVVGDIISRVTGKSSGTVLREKIFEPLGMARSSTRTADHPSDGNVARGYSILDNGDLLPWDYPKLEDGDIQGSAGYVRSCAKDMLIWAKAVMDAEDRETNSETLVQQQPADHANTLKEMSIIRTAHRPITTTSSQYENSYGLGWFRHMLPSSWLSTIGPNFALLPDPPVINRNGPPRLVISHWGEFNGFLTSFYTIPDTKTAIIVMANCSPSRGDPTDLIAQTIIQDMFTMTPEVNFIAFAEQAAKTSRLIWPRLVEDWISNRVQDTKHRALDEYVERYVATAYKITVTVSKIADVANDKKENPELLEFNVNSLPRQQAKLRHYHYDTWTFLPDNRDDAVSKGMEGYLHLPMLLLDFVANEADIISGFRWDLQAGACEGPTPEINRLVQPILFKRLS